MSACKPEISYDDYLKVVALATLANEHYRKASAFSAAAQGIILCEPELFPGNKLDDAIYSIDRVHVSDIDTALEVSGVVVLRETDEDPTP